MISSHTRVNLINRLLRIIDSTLFEFVVTEEEKSFFLHCDAIAGLSPALRALINGGMREAQERRVVWPDVRTDTFIRFAQFAYSGDYDYMVLKMVEISTGNDSEQSRSEFLATIQTKEGRDESVQKRYDQVACNISSSTPHTNTNTPKSYLPLFLGHARLYSLAEKYRVESLKTLTLNKLEQCLAQYKNYDGWDLDIVELIEYAFSDDNTPAEGEDQLRKCLIGYLMGELRAIGKFRRFSTMLESGGAFARSFWPQMLQKFQEMENSVERLQKSERAYRYYYQRFLSDYIGGPYNILGL